MIDTKCYTRVEVRQDIEHFNENSLNQSALDLDLDCPSEAEMTLFLEDSLYREEQVLGLEQAWKLRANHIESFWVKNRSLAFCTVNSDAVLQSSQWRQFLSKYSKNEG